MAEAPAKKSGPLSPPVISMALGGVIVFLSWAGLVEASGFVKIGLTVLGLALIAFGFLTSK
jgi:hypothetical protein